MPKWKRKKKHRVSRKDQPDHHSIGEWSRMLHKWWKIDALQKKEFKKEKVSISR